MRAIVVTAVLMLSGCQQQEQGLVEFEGQRFTGKLVELDSVPTPDSNVWIAVTSEAVHLDLDANCEYFSLEFQQAGGSNLKNERPRGSLCSNADRVNLTTVVEFLGRGASVVSQDSGAAIVRSSDGHAAKFEAQSSIPFVD